jgi:hypothetical protein
VTLLVFGSVHNLNYNFDTIQIIIPNKQGLRKFNYVYDIK